MRSPPPVTGKAAGPTPLPRGPLLPFLRLPRRLDRLHLPGDGFRLRQPREYRPLLPLRPSPGRRRGTLLDRRPESSRSSPGQDHQGLRPRRERGESLGSNVRRRGRGRGGGSPGILSPYPRHPTPNTHRLSQDTQKWRGRPLRTGPSASRPGLSPPAKPGHSMAGNPKRKGGIERVQP